MAAGAPGQAGAPAVSIPVLRSADGLPVGITLIAGRGCDQALLGLATAATAGDPGRRNGRVRG